MNPTSDKKERLFDNTEERLVSPKEAARLLALSQSMIYKMGDTGRLTKVQIGRSVRYRYSEIRNLLVNG